MKLEWPYGKWTCASRREVLFNRSYWPIWQRVEGIVTPNDNLGEGVADIVADEFYFDDWTAPWRNRRAWKDIRKVMDEWGIVPTIPVFPY